MTTLVLVFRKIESENRTKCDTFYLKLKAETTINESDIDDLFESIYSGIISKSQKSLGKDSEWIINSVIDHNVSISKYNPLAGSSCIKLLKELDHPKTGLIKIQNIDNNECFKRCLVRYLNHANHYQARITKADKGFPKKLDFKSITFPVKFKDIHKIEKKNSIWISVFGYKIKEKHPI